MTSTISRTSSEAKLSVLYLGKDKYSENKISTLLGSHISNYLTADNCDNALALFKQYAIDTIVAETFFLRDMPDCTIHKLRHINNNINIILINENYEVISSPFDLPCLAKEQCPLKPTSLDNLFNAISDSRKESDKNDLIHITSSAFFHSSVAMTITSHDNKIIAVNTAFTQITGFKQHEILGKNPRILSSGKHDKQFYGEMWTALSREKKWSGEIWNKRKNGELFLEWITINAITNSTGEITHYCSIFADITERRAAEEAICRLTYNDPLTDLPNRRAFMERLEDSLVISRKNNQLCAILFLDLDNFKDINDTLGHDIGDAVIKETASRLKMCIREDDLIARLGGDEFTVCLTDMNSAEDASTVAQKLLDAMSSPFILDEERLYFSFSIGIALFPEHGETTQELLKHADQAMYHAKFSGRNKFSFFDVSMAQHALNKTEIVKHLRNSMGSDQFSIHYQPIVNLETGMIDKAESLLRWTHPELGYISPDEFIPIAEDIGLICELGDWVFRQSASQVKSWQEKFKENFQLSINISPKQFQNESCDLEEWTDFLSQKALSNKAVSLEITEGVMMNEGPMTEQRLGMLKLAGIEISLDDFGTGYSSLAYLKKLNVDYLKIDRTFIQNIHINHDDQAMCEAIVVMAHKLNIKVIAEGVENEAQLNFLKSVGCDYAQGYWFSKPVTSDDFELLLSENGAQLH